MNIKNVRQLGSSTVQLQTSENLTLAVQLLQKGVIGLRQEFRHEGITIRIRTEVENLVIWSVKRKARKVYLLTLSALIPEATH
jgi:hypothetical protein